MWKNREEAAQKLAELLKAYRARRDVVVVALPRGGVVLGRVVADALEAPLDIVVPRKIGMPGEEEYAVGALAETGEIIWNKDEKKRLDDEALAPIIEKEKQEQARRLKLYRGTLPARDWEGKTVIIVDDGIATGLTMLAGIASAKALHPKKIVVAVPLAPPDSIEIVKSKVDELLVLRMPNFLGAIGAFYGEFLQVNDERVIKLMKL